MIWKAWRRKGICLGILWGILTWIPFLTPYWQSVNWLIGLPAVLGMAGETLLLRLGGRLSLLLNACFLSVPVGALLGYGLSLPGQLYWRRQEAKRATSGHCSIKQTGG
ncbi:MAG: hypothetical protein ACOX8W_08240 [bacterium]